MVIALRAQNASSGLAQRTAASVHLDTLRAVAAMAVLFYHWRYLLFVDYRSVSHHSALTLVAYTLTGLGRQAVIVFFVLSGYLVGRNALRNFAEGWKWGPYLLNRMTRLWIVVVPAVALGWMWDWAGVRFLGNAYLFRDQQVIPWHIADRLSWPVVLGNVFFLQGVRVPTIGSNGAFWSLANEFWYYMLFPVLLLTFSRRSKPFARILWGMLAAVVVWFVGFSITFLFLVWLMGAALVYAPQWKPQSKVSLNVAIAGAGILVFGVANIQRLMGRWENATDLALGISCTLLLWLLLQARERVPMTWSRRTWAGLAGMSYSLYLLHLSVLGFLISVVNRQERWAPDVYHVSVGLGILICVFLYSLVLYLCFERNTGRIRAWLASLGKEPTAAPGDANLASVTPDPS